MRLHPSSVRKLLHIFEAYGGHREEIKLKQALENLDMSVYSMQTPPARDVLVFTDALKEAIRNL
jgi:hypothetical protein